MHGDPSIERHYALIDSLTSRGPDHLSDFELLTRLFAREFTEEMGAAASLEVHDFPELTFFKGIGEAKAAAIIAGVELGRRSSKSERRRESLPRTIDAGNISLPGMSN